MTMSEQSPSPWKSSTSDEALRVYRKGYEKAVRDLQVHWFKWFSVRRNLHLDVHFNCSHCVRLAEHPKECAMRQCEVLRSGDLNVHFCIGESDVEEVLDE